MKAKRQEGSILMKKEYALNPFLPEFEYIPDGEPHVFDGRVYLYGSHDRAHGNKFCMNDYVCYSADCNDLKNWRYEGVIYKRMEDQRFHEKYCEMWAPDVVRGYDGRFYLYYTPSEIKGIGVAVCDTPAGTYKFHGIVHNQDGSLPVMDFDPAAFADDDGTIYLYAGGGPRVLEEGGEVNGRGAYAYVLDKDMLTIKKASKLNVAILGESEGTAYEGHELFEASSMRKIRGKYYYIYSSCMLHELCYAVSDRPDGGFEYGGVIISNIELMEDGPDDQIAKNTIGNNHGSIECINGEYYIFYHRHTNGTMLSRQACAERIEIAEDGKIRQARLSSCGLNGDPLPGSGTYPAFCACLLYGKHPHQICFGDIERRLQPYLTQEEPDFDMEDVQGAKTLPRQYIKNMQDGMHAVFREFKLQGLKKIQVTVRGTAAGYLHVLAGENGNPICSVEIKPAQEWTVFETAAAIKDGVYALDFSYQGDGAL